MSYTFRVVFDGVCAYVPDKRFFKKEGGIWQKRCEDTEGPDSGPVRSLAVLLPDLRRPGRPRVPQDLDLNFPSFREPHFPLLEFRLDDLRQSTTRRVDLVCRDISEKDEKGLLLLRREQIRFKLDAENATVFSWSDWAPHPPPKKQKNYCGNSNVVPEWWGKEPDLGEREQLESLWWLPDLSRILDNDNVKAMTARRDVLPSYRGPFPDSLIARVECKGGRLRTFDFNRDVDGKPLRWRFAPPGKPDGEGAWNRALANSLALEFFDVRSEVRIELRRLANEVVIEELVLAPAPGASRPVLEINISNREPDLLFQEEGFSRAVLPDVDFQPFYEYLSDAPSESVHQLPIPHPALDLFFGIREKPCAGTAMLGQG